MMATPLPETPDAPPKDELKPALVYGESATRSFVKALAWRLTAGVVTLVRRILVMVEGGGGGGVGWNVHLVSTVVMVGLRSGVRSVSSSSICRSCCSSGKR